MNTSLYATQLKTGWATFVALSVCCILLVSCGPGPQVDSEWVFDRIAAVRNLTDQTVLERIAMEDEDAGVRHNAVVKLTNQALLAKIVLQDDCGDIRHAAVERITDQTLLAKIAVEGNGDIHHQVKSRLTDPTLLAMIGMWVRPGLTERVSDQELLAKIALTSDAPEIRDAAIRTLSDVTLLLRVFINAKTHTVRMNAYSRLASDITIARLSAIAESDSSIRSSVAVLANLFRTLDYKDRTEDWEIIHWLMTPPYSTDLGYIEDFSKQQTIMHNSNFYRTSDNAGVTLSRTGNWISVKLSKVDKPLSCGGMPDPEWRTTLNVETVITLWNVVEECLPYLSERSLAKLAMEFPEERWQHFRICSDAIERIHTQTILVEVALNSKYWHAAEKAIEKITDQATLGRIAVQTKTYGVGVKATEKITNQTVLGEIALKSNCRVVRKFAQDRLSKLQTTSK